MGVWKQLQIERMELESAIENLEEDITECQLNGDEPEFIRGLKNKLDKAVSDLEDFASKYPNI